MNSTIEVSSLDAGSLWQRFHGELMGFLRPRVASDALAEDILQSAFLRAHQHLATGEAPENPRAWLYQIVRNLIIDAHRRAGRQGALADAVASDPTSSPEPTAIEEDTFAMVARALPMFIATLQTPYREALQMTELEGLTQAEAAERAGVSISGMKSRVQRGRKQVFDALQRCCEFELDARGHMMACTPRFRPDPCC